jgi:hypothetical protein
MQIISPCGCSCSCMNTGISGVKKTDRYNHSCNRLDHVLARWGYNRGVIVLNPDSISLESRIRIHRSLHRQITHSVLMLSGHI